MLKRHSLKRWSIDLACALIKTKTQKIESQSLFPSHVDYECGVTSFLNVLKWMISWDKFSVHTLLSD